MSPWHDQGAAFIHAAALTLAAGGRLTIDRETIEQASRCSLQISTDAATGAITYEARQFEHAGSATIDACSGRVTYGEQHP